MKSRPTHGGSEDLDQPGASDLPPALSIRVDGVETARLNPDEDHEVEFELGANAEWIEVVAFHAGHEIPLASWLVPFDPESGEPQAVASSVLISDGGQRLSLETSPREARAAVSIELGVSSAESSETTRDAAPRSASARP